jgi:CRP/FNR family transcriptional activator FtrB
MALDKTDVERLRSIHLFNSVSDSLFPALVRTLSIRYSPARARLFAEGDHATALYIPLEGSVELFSENHVRRSTIAVVRSPKPFLVTSILDERNLLSARTLQRSLLVLIPLKLVHELIDADAVFARAMMDEILSALRDVVVDFNNHRLRPAAERLAEWMMRSDQDAGGKGQFVIPYDKRTLASYLGMAPENLSRSLVSLAAVGVSVQGRHVVLKDRAALAAFAGMGTAVPLQACASAGLDEPAALPRIPQTA